MLRRAAGTTPKVVAVVAIAVGLVLASAVLFAPRTEAHGKELRITVVPLVPDPSRPLDRLYRVEVIYASDAEPVTGATVIFRARREEPPGEIPPFRLTEVRGNEGLYVGDVTFERFGSWVISLQVEAPGGLGDGSVTFNDDVRPGFLNPAEEAAMRAEGERVIRLQLLFGFDWWPDAVNIVMRVLHSLAGLSYFLATSLAFTLVWIGVPASRPDLPRLLSRFFLPIALGSLALLLGAGLYSAAYDAPIVPPGIYDVSTLTKIPYGEWYLAAFLVKPVMFVALAVLAVRIRYSLREWAGCAPQDSRVPPDGEAAAVLRRQTLLNAVIGLIVIADVAVLIYLHYVSHLGVFLPNAA